MSASDEIIQKYQDGKEYDHGFVTEVDTIDVPKGLSEETIKFISKQKKEPSWMLEWRLSAYARLQKMKEPDWQKPKYPKGRSRRRICRARCTRTANRAPWFGPGLAARFQRLALRARSLVTRTNPIRSPFDSCRMRISHRLGLRASSPRSAGWVDSP